MRNFFFRADLYFSDFQVIDYGAEGLIDVFMAYYNPDHTQYFDAVQAEQLVRIGCH